MEDTFIDIDVGDAIELRAVEEGNYTVLCNNVEKKENDNGPYLLLRCEIPDIIESKGITYFQRLPDSNFHDAKELNRHKIGLKEMAEGFGVDISQGFHLSDFVNQEAEVYLGVDETEEYGRQNRIVRFVSGPGEAEENRAADLSLE